MLYYEGSILGCYLMGNVCGYVAKVVYTHKYNIEYHSKYDFAMNSVI